MPYKLKSCLAREVKDNLTRLPHVIQYDTRYDCHLSNLLGQRDQTHFDDAWVRCLNIDSTPSTDTSDEDEEEDQFWTRLPIFGYQFPHCDSDTGFDTDKLTLPDAFGRFCQGLAGKEGKVLKHHLCETYSVPCIDPSSEPDYQENFLNRLATILNDTFRDLSHVFRSFGNMTCKVVTQQDLSRLFPEEHLWKSIRMKPDWALLVTYTDENGQTKRILPLVFECKNVQSKAIAGAHFCRDFKAQHHTDRYVVRPGTDDKHELDTVWHDENFDHEEHNDDHFKDRIDNNRICEAVVGFYSALQRAAIPAFLHGGRTYGIIDSTGIFLHQRKSFHPAYGQPQPSLDYLRTTHWFQRFTRNPNNGVPAYNDSPEILPTDSLFVKHLNQNGWQFDIVCMVFKILEETFSGFRIYLERRAQYIAQLAPGDTLVDVPGFANVRLSRELERSAQAMKGFYKRAYDELCLSTATSALRQIGQSNVIERETSTFEFNELLTAGMLGDNEYYLPYTVFHRKHKEINNGNEFVLRVFKVSDPEVEYFLNEVRALKRLNERSDREFPGRRYWPELYEFGYIHGPLREANVNHDDIFLYSATEYIPRIGKASIGNRELAMQCKEKLEEAGVRLLNWSMRSLLVCRDNHGRHCRAVNFTHSEIVPKKEG